MSIPIQQLRVGSYWQLNTKTGRVFKIVTPCEIADAAEYGIGIELTPEVLEKFGFNWSIFHQANHKEGFDFDLNELHKGGYSLTTFKRRLVIVEKIDHLHQLQNLYFALTGTELTYTL